MIDGSSCLQRRIFSDVSRVFGSEDKQRLLWDIQGRGEALCGVEVGGGQISLMALFGWYLFRG